MTKIKTIKKGEFQIVNLLNDHENGLVILSGKLIDGLVRQGDKIQINNEKLSVLLLEVSAGEGSNILIHVSMPEFNASEFSKATSKKFDILANSND